MRGVLWLHGVVIGSWWVWAHRLLFRSQPTLVKGCFVSPTALIRREGSHREGVREGLERKAACGCKPNLVAAPYLTLEMKAPFEGPRVHGNAIGDT